jgi:DNA-binding MarR family transcriptional regulator
MVMSEIDHPILFKVHRLSRSLLRASMAYYLHEFELGVPQVQILHALIPGPLASKAIADVLAMNKALISRAVRELEDRGYVTGVSGVDDGRLRIWSLTDKGEEFVTMARPIRIERQRKFLSVLTREEQLLLEGVLDKLYESSEALRVDEAQLITNNTRP